MSDIIILLDYEYPDVSRMLGPAGYINYLYTS